ncbi:MAG TPA: hypothetical protein DD379_04435 [Cyanobacteria bacterium UBA11162]|nr:hypothetical protein [Cyanobacteria bacterium UBA11162]
MALRKFTRFVAALVLGLVLTLSSYPAHSQDFPSFEVCLNEVESYPSKQNLNQYNQRQVYCLFVVELLNGGVQADKEYYNAELFGIIMNALRDTNDGEDDKLTYKQIIKAFPGNQLNRLINESIDQVEIEFPLSQSSPIQVASVRITSDISQPSFTLAGTSGRSPGGGAMKQVSSSAARRK